VNVHCTGPLNSGLRAALDRLVARRRCAPVPGGGRPPCRWSIRPRRWRCVVDLGTGADPFAALAASST
jgi:hypothetical protein